MGQITFEDDGACMKKDAAYAVAHDFSRIFQLVMKIGTDCWKENYTGPWYEKRYIGFPDDRFTVFLKKKRRIILPAKYTMEVDINNGSHDYAIHGDIDGSLKELFGKIENAGKD